jgi:hypothetical protein
LAWRLDLAVPGTGMIGGPGVDFYTSFGQLLLSVDPWETMRGIIGLVASHRGAARLLIPLGGIRKPITGPALELPDRWKGKM